MENHSTSTLVIKLRYQQRTMFWPKTLAKVNILMMAPDWGQDMLQQPSQHFALDNVC
jgi:hypothetical protein